MSELRPDIRSSLFAFERHEIEVMESLKFADLTSQCERKDEDRQEQFP